MKAMKNSGIEWIGQIPEDWNIVRVKQAFIRKNEKAQQENPVVLSLARAGVKVRDVSTNEGQVAESYYNYNPVSVGDLLLNPMDLYSGANCSLSEVEGVISPAYVNLKNKEGYFSKFYDYYFKVQYWMMVLFAHGKGVSFDNRWTLNHETLMNFPIVSPAYETQKRIADFLDEKCGKIDRYIEKQQQVIEKLKAYKQSVITEAVTKGLNPTVPMKDSGIEWMGIIPEHWDVAAVGRVATVVRGASPRPAGDPRYFNGKDVPWITVSEVTKDDGKYIDSTETYLTNEGSTHSRMVQAGTLLLSNSGATLGVPKVTNITGCINDGSVAFLDLNVSQMYLLYVFKSRTFELRKQMQGYGQPNLNTAIVKAIMIPIPSVDEQELICEYLDKKCVSIDFLIEEKNRIIQKLTEYKKSLIYEAVTGKLEV